MAFDDVTADSVIVTGALLVLGWDVSAIMADAVAAHHKDDFVTKEDTLNDISAPAHSAQQQWHDTVVVVHPNTTVGSPSSSAALCVPASVCVIEGFGTQYAEVRSTSSACSYTSLMSRTH